MSAELEPVQQAVETREVGVTKADLDSLVLRWDDARREVVAAGDVEGAVLALTRLRAFRASLSILIDQLDQDAAELLGPVAGFLDLPGIGIVTKHRKSTKTKWDADGMLKEIIQQAIENGDIDHPLDVARAITRVAAISYFRITDAKKLGIDPYPYREQELGAYTVQVQGQGEDV